MQVEITDLHDDWCTGCLVAVSLGILLAIFATWRWFAKGSSRNPFSQKDIRDPEPIETDQKRRDQVIKQGLLN